MKVIYNMNDNVSSTSSEIFFNINTYISEVKIVFRGLKMCSSQLGQVTKRTVGTADSLRPGLWTPSVISLSQ